jgi:hypothetical protein
MTALLHFASAPAVYYCHSSRAWQEAPISFPRIYRYLAVSDSTLARLRRHGIPAERIERLPNFVDLDRFRPRPPLPERPRRVAVFSNKLGEENHLPAIRAACTRAGLELETIGMGSGHAAARPWELLGRYDIVFASGRSALEAMAVGAAVVLCNDLGLGPLVTATRFDELRAANFGIDGERRGPVTVEEVEARVRDYCAADATEVTRRVRTEGSLAVAVDRLVAIYGEVIAEHARTPAAAPGAEARAAAAHLRMLSSQLKDLAELQTMRNSLTWRLRSRLLRVPGLRRTYRWLRRLGSH